MNITSDKIISNSNDYQKKIKEDDSLSVGKISKNKMSEKLLKDFSTVSSNDSYIKAKIINNNIRLTNYENNISKNQFINTKLEELNSLVKNEKNDDAWKIIDETKFDNKTILSDRFTKNAPLIEQIDYFKTVNNIDKANLEKEFMSIQIASQNLSSVSSNVKSVNQEYNTADNISSKSIKNMNIDSKRVMELII